MILEGLASWEQRAQSERGKGKDDDIELNGEKSRAQRAVSSPHSLEHHLRSTNHWSPTFAFVLIPKVSLVPMHLVSMACSHEASWFASEPLRWCHRMNQRWCFHPPPCVEMKKRELNGQKHRLATNQDSIAEQVHYYLTAFFVSFAEGLTEDVASSTFLSFFPMLNDQK